MTVSQKEQPVLTDVESPLSDLEELVGYNLKRAYVAVQEDFREALGQDGISAGVFSALSLTIESPNITQSKLARLLGIERSGLVAIVDDLEARGFLIRTAVPGDRRVQALVPTDAGRNAYAKAVTKVRTHEQRLLYGFTDREKQGLMRLLKKIRQVGERV